MKKLIPIILALFGTAAGVAAGVFFAAPAEKDTAQAHTGTDCVVDGSVADTAATLRLPDEPSEFVKLNNQFVVPVVENEEIISLVVASLSLEVREGTRETVFRFEPRLRDAFLQVMFDHANAGGFNGRFTAGTRLDLLRENLRMASRPMLGNDLYDVLITEIARQDQ
ncbi:flagellar basal body-associated protein FliL [Cognatishimia sp. F0-27]|uniref:flagellar basal body-associated protein FliL n=1 Tax=Cognatishimia sp. F0-27 TaxID=2816855 RepID=UPI001D0CDA5C|nr:flagellar basal body-associated protein FliL [Cognatishimia sp. F0-27]MCC1491222.1 flagellar basal body-associated FliL family protein [Cognatishimia sp. F0-27]